MIRWTAERIALLGTMTDAAAARKIGVSAISVSFHRYAMGIPRYRRGEARWVEAAVALLGKLPDRVLAKKLGCSVQTVFNKRRDLGIEACHKHYRKKSSKRACKETTALV